MLPTPCPYLHDREWRLEYEIAVKIKPDDLLERLKEGWRRHSYYFFRPACLSCHACQTLRVPVQEFKPNRSQRRVIKTNANTEYVIRSPLFTARHVEIFMSCQSHHYRTRDWPEESLESSTATVRSFVEDPVAIQEWDFYIDNTLVGVMYVDRLPDGFSAIYSYHDPAYRKYSIGTLMILSLLEYARMQGFSHVYLGYYIKDCLSMQYKSKFAPNEILTPDGTWRPLIEQGSLQSDNDP
jgi:arginine-tRNA-protein transferase